ncbi:hypothetical protein KBB59_03080 [Candidatus Woesebacteria bacterium]|jgi:hypothetical protein|nr:hypothetical protein [Candidatus Woesebacteria bacterium]HOC07789.1 hypothetical protein [Candidatus Woesebacteria bacterium]HQO51754.1 hypothetical protein [Candidatus Woesebacteria bacterium]
MRIIRFLSSSLIFIIFFLLIGIFFGREILLIMATSDLKRAANALLSASHLVNCYDGFSRSPSAWGQLRFVDDSNYVLETVCSDFPKRPILIESKKLPIFVKKVNGASGFIFNSQKPIASQITIRSLGKDQLIYKEINDLESGQPPAVLDYVAGPASTCQAFNFQCCQEDIELGVGVSQTLATDCPKDCYQSCQPRPLVLSFNAMPASLENRRIISVKSGQTVTFAYVVSEGNQELFSGQVMVGDTKDSSFLQWKSRWQTLVQLINNLEDNPVKQVQLPITSTIFFGDGQSQTSQSLQGVIDHVYTCSEAVCYFNAWIEAQDARLTKSADNELTRLQIIVSN